MADFTPTSLPEAIKKLFELNHYLVEGPIQIHGAEIDLVARPISDPFGVSIYIEATVEYVDNDKYGKDVGKLAMIGKLDPNAQGVIISSRGFSLPVRERANATGLKTFTYDELFRKFERFDPYITLYTDNSEQAEALSSLNSVYEEPFFEDQNGKNQATEFLTNWKNADDGRKGWLIVTGEYGTGKTAMTKVLQYRWLQEYKTNPSLALPFRIELRDFSRQFDARGLIHHFLDHNKLSHISIEFVYSLIRTGRVILLLDGYDEMAQYLHTRERRACLEALAELSAGGAKGILTSRPNYFTEAEEMHVFEVLYSSLVQDQYFLTSQSKTLIEREKEIDKLLEQFIYRYERTLRDLTPEQTEALIKRVLAQDTEGKELVLNILRRIFRTSQEGDTVSLSGKPIIISYLLEVVENLKNTEQLEQVDTITEWQVYKLIVDQLMLRDLARSPELPPHDRRRFLHKLAVFLSQREHMIAKEEHFYELIAKEFKRNLNRLPSDSRKSQIERYYADLRSSATLTRSTARNDEGWRFSHNSLREYLVVEHLLNNLSNESIVQEEVPISDAMQYFSASRNSDEKHASLESLRKQWRIHGTERGRGQLLSLMWQGFTSLFNGNDPSRSCLLAISGEPLNFNSIHVSKIDISTENKPSNLREINFSNSTLSAIKFISADLTNSDFSNTTLENVNFMNSDLSNANFSNSLIVDSDFTWAEIKGANFSGISSDYISILVVDTGNVSNRRRIEGINALGYLQYHGAITDKIPTITVLRNHPRYQIVEKILEKLADQAVRQRLGLEQKGAARENIPFAKTFVDHLENKGIIRSKRHDLVQVTDHGRTVLAKFTNHELAEEIIEFLQAY